MTDLRDIYRQWTRDVAGRFGTGADYFYRQIELESAGFDPDVVQCRRDSPAGARGIAQIMPQFHPGVDPCDPRAALEYAADLMSTGIRLHGWRDALIAYNWGPGNLMTWQKNGSRWSDLPSETQRYIEIIMGASAVPDPVYDPSTPVTPQSSGWDCAEQSTLWAMTAYGRHPSDAWMEASMLTSGIESTDLGLLVADGSKLAAWITEQYGEFNYHAYNNGSVSFDDVISVAGTSPVIIGGRQWNHWSGVRRYDTGNKWLELANPSDGWMGIQQTMTRQQFDALGPFSMVVVQWGTAQPAPPPAPVPPVDQSAQIAELQAQVATLTQQRDGLISKLGYLQGDVAGALEAAVNTLRSA